MPIDTAELALRGRDDTKRLQKMMDDAAGVNDPIRKDIGPNGLPKAGIYHGTKLIREIGGEPLEGSGFENEDDAASRSV